MASHYKTPLPEISRLTFGTGRVDDVNNPEHIKAVHAAMEAGLWFHSCEYYGDGRVFDVLNKAFKERLGSKPQLILKVDGQSPQKLDATIRRVRDKLDLDCIPIAQVCGNPAIESIRPGGGLSEMMAKLLSEGLVGHYTLEIFKDFSDNLIHAVDEELFGSVIFYFNISECQVSEEIYDLIQTKNIPVLALRTLGGSTLDAIEDSEQRSKLQMLYEASGFENAMAFQVGYPLSYPFVKTTIAGTSQVKHLHSLIDHAALAQPLPPDVLTAIRAIQR